MPKCAKCTVPLVPGENWTPGQVKKKQYICAPCHNKRTLQWKADSPKAARAARKRYNRTEKGRFSKARDNAMRRGKRWSLTQEQFSALIVLPCTYCYSPPAETTGSNLDRIDNRSGYAIDNVVPCCGDCNTTRNDTFSYDEMVAFIGPAVRAAKERRNVQVVLHCGANGSRPAVGPRGGVR